ncbi:MAG: alcohol dehydrogenase [Spirochaetae bacterium HGW-Spirochaetae-3]|nr:MAG: alcohol dehydrogenase [Spirochaetae bacterium HGW-Spirochaetae-3]
METVWFRTYQSVMRLAVNFLDFSPPEVLQGAGSIKRLPDFIKSKGFSKVLIVTDKGLMAVHLLDGLFASLELAGVAYSLFDGAQANPTIQNIEDALVMYGKEGCQAIVAFGGGSSMDCAKGCAARVTNPRKTVPRLRGLLKVSHRPATVFAVPTTAGTGSETTIAAVITDPSTHEKYAINDPKLIPPYAVLDPELTIGLPPHITSTTGMDALTHAVEAYIGRSNTANTIEKAERAVALIFGNVETAYNDGKNIEARANMLLASFYGGIAFTRAYVGYVHAIAHNLGGLYGLPHGLANAVILPYVLDFFGDSASAPLARLADIAGVSKPGQDAAAKAASFIAAVRDLNRRMAIPEGFEQIKEADIPMIIDRAFREAHPLYPVPKFMSRADCEAVLRKLMR